MMEDSAQDLDGVVTCSSLLTLWADSVPMHVIVVMSSRGCTSSFRGRGRSTMKSISHKPPTISNKSCPSDTKQDSMSTGPSKHGLESFGTAEGTPPPTIGVPWISPTASPVNDLPSPDQTPNSSEASTDNVLWVEGGQTNSVKLFQSSNHLFAKNNIEIPEELRKKADISFVQCVGGEVK